VENVLLQGLGIIHS